MLVVIGAGDLTARPQPEADKKKGVGPRIPVKVRGAVQRKRSRDVLRLNECVFHGNGTAYEGVVSPSRGALFFGERAVWFSCVVGDWVWADELVQYPGDFNVRIFVDEFGFDSNPTTPVLSIAKAYPKPMFNLTLCSSAIYGITGTKWLIEWIEYHRAAGYDSLDLYIHDIGTLAQDVLNRYVSENSNEFFIRLNDWIKIVDGGIYGFDANTGVGHGVFGEEWQLGQRLIRNDCYLRNRGRSKWIMMSDLDELFVSAMPQEPRIWQGPILQVCEKLYQKNPLKIACSFSSVTVPPYADELSYTETPDHYETFFERITISESHCHDRYNCGKFHLGREKFALRTEFGSLNLNSPLFYHAVSRNYDIAERFHVWVDAETQGYVRHYAGHFAHCRNGGLSVRNKRHRPLPELLLQGIRNGIRQKSDLYFAPQQNEQFLGLYEIWNTWRFAKDFGTLDASEIQVRDEFVQEHRRRRQQQQQPDVVVGGEEDGEGEGEFVVQQLQQQQKRTQPSYPRYFTFDYFGGRLNNQLWTLDWVFRFSAASNRTAIIGSPLKSEHYVGFPINAQDASLWDISQLSKSFAFLFEWELTTEQHEMIYDEELPEECAWKFSKHGKYTLDWALRSGPKRCEHVRFHFFSGEGLLHPYKADLRFFHIDPLMFWANMRLHDDFAIIAREWWEQVGGAASGSSIGVHFRTWREANGDDAHAKRVCLFQTEKLLRNSKFSIMAWPQCCGLTSVSPLAAVWNKARTGTTALSCDPASASLLYEMVGGKNVLDGASAREELFMATDHDSADADQIFSNLGVKMMNLEQQTLVLKAKLDLFLSRFDSSKAIGTQHSTRDLAEKLAPILLDVQVLLETDRFFGSPASTLSHGVCLWRKAMGKAEEVPGMCQLVWLSTFSDLCEYAGCGRRSS